MSKVTSWILDTPSLLEGVELINGIEEKKFPLVLNRIAQTIQNSTEEFCPFTDEEEDKLLSTLTGVESKNDLKTILDVSAYILLQAAYNVTKPTNLQKDLMDVLKMNESKAEMFFNVWSSNAKKIVEKLRQKSIHDPQLDGLSWMLNVNAASSANLQCVQQRAVIELKLKQDSDSVGNIVMDVNQSQLYQFYETLEKIQTELDNLR